MPYHQFKDDEGYNDYGSFEVFYLDQKAIDQDFQDFRDSETGENDMTPGWYWWACFPGCLPDSDPNGPFDTEQDAINDAQDA